MDVAFTVLKKHMDYTNVDSDEITKIKKNILYALITNHDLRLSENICNKQQFFYTIKVDSDQKILLFLNYAIIYFIENRNRMSLGKSKKTIGLDFEFNNKNIGLAQISFYPYGKNKYIFIIDPKKLNDTQKKIFAETIFTSKIRRIVHGAESLDIPYIFEEILSRDPDQIIKFTNTTIDTRFLCEYIKLYSKHSDNKCSIYDALLYFKVINKNKYEELQKINKKIGPIYRVKWDINKISDNELKYVLYDVLYLKCFLIKILNIFSDDSLRKQLNCVYEIDRLTIYKKYELFEISNILSEMKRYVDNKNSVMVNKYDNFMKKTIVSFESRLVNINNFKKTLTILFKFILYSRLDNINNINNIDNNKNNKNVHLLNIFNILKELNLKKVYSLLLNFYELSLNNI